MFSQDAESFTHTLVGCDFNGYVGAVGRRRLGRMAIKADDVFEASDESPHEGAADCSARSRHKDRAAFCFHRVDL